MQHKVDTENKVEELKAQHAKDTHMWQEQLRSYKKQLQAAEQTIKDNNQTILKAQMKDKKNEQTIKQIQQLLAKKERKVAQEAEERVVVCSFANYLQVFIN